MKFILNLFEFINESKEVDIYNKYSDNIDNHTFDILKLIDITPTKKYLDKICKYFIEMDSVVTYTAKIEDLTHLISSFDNLVKKKIINGSDSDINKYKNIDQLRNIVNTNINKESNTLIKKLKKQNVIIETDNDDLTILVPLDIEASKVYGSNTRWCIAARNNISNAYDGYFAKRKNIEYYNKLLEGAAGIEDEEEQCFVIFIINKKLESSNPLYKIGIQCDMDGIVDIFDALDTTTYMTCIRRAKELHITLSDSYHDMMKKYKNYKDYVKSQCDINRVYKSLKSKYFIKPHIDVDRKNRYLEFILPNVPHDGKNIIIDDNSWNEILTRFDSIKKPIPDELYHIVNETVNKRTIISYYNAISEWLKYNKININIKFNIYTDYNMAIKLINAKMPVEFKEIYLSYMDNYIAKIKNISDYHVKELKIYTDKLFKIPKEKINLYNIDIITFYVDTDSFNTFKDSIDKTFNDPKKVILHHVIPYKNR